MLASGWVLGKDFAHIKHGLVQTSPATQSRTDDVVLAAMNRASLGAMSAEQAYVTVSRGRERGMVFTDLPRENCSGAGAGDGRTSATELFGRRPEQPEKPAAAAPPWQRMRPFMERLRRSIASGSEGGRGGHRGGTDRGDGVMHDEATIRAIDPGRVRPRRREGGALPALADAYKAAATPDNQEIRRLVLVMGKDGFKPGGRRLCVPAIPASGPGRVRLFGRRRASFRFVIADLQPKLVPVHGRNLLRICDYIGLRRIPGSAGGPGFPPRRRRGRPRADHHPIEVADWERSPG